MRRRRRVNIAPSMSSAKTLRPLSKEAVLQANDDGLEQAVGAAIDLMELDSEK